MAKRGNGEGSIYRRNDGRWVGEMTIEGRQRKFVYGKTRKDVQEKLRAAIQEKQEGVVLTGRLGKRSNSFSWTGWRTHRSRAFGLAPMSGIERSCSCTSCRCLGIKSCKSSPLSMCRRS